MYHEDIKRNRQYRYYVETCGHPSVFGYKDFISMFTGARFDPDDWAELFKRSGAKRSW